MISIIVPVYNLEKFLSHCINSILGQEYREFELLLINDGSNDRSGEICDEYAAKDSRIRVFHKENGGVSSARNLGLDNAKGEWITFVDGDDVLLPMALTHILDVTIKDNAALYIFDNNINSQPKIQNIGSVLTKNEFIKLLLLYKIQSSPWAKVYKAEDINDLRFNTLLSIGEDWLFNFEYAMKHRDNMRIVHNKHSVYDYINREGSAMLSKSIKMKYDKLNEIAIPIVSKLLSGKMVDEVKIFEIINIFQPNFMLGVAPSKNEDKIIMMLPKDTNNNFKILFTYAKYLNVSRVLAHLYFYYIKWKGKVKNNVNRITTNVV